MTATTPKYKTPKTKLVTHLAIFISSGFYSGFAPKAPGTAGTALAACLVGILFTVAPITAQLLPLLLLCIGATILGVLASNISLSSGYFGTEAKDPGQIVIDEFAGYFVALLGVGAQLEDLLLAFVLFRCFDILKPPPIRYLEKLPAGLGIMIDDVMAGIYAAIVGYMLLRFF